MISYRTTCGLSIAVEPLPEMDLNEKLAAVPYLRHSA
jgi:hypothetical protein